MELRVVVLVHVDAWLELWVACRLDGEVVHVSTHYVVLIEVAAGNVATNPVRADHVARARVLRSCSKVDDLGLPAYSISRRQGPIWPILLLLSAPLCGFCSLS